MHTHQKSSDRIGTIDLDIGKMRALWPWIERACKRLAHRYLLTIRSPTSSPESPGPCSPAAATTNQGSLRDAAILDSLPGVARTVLATLLAEV